MKKAIFSKRSFLLIALMVMVFSFSFSLSFASEQTTITAEEEGIVKSKVRTSPQAMTLATSGRYFVKFKAKHNSSDESMVKGHGATIRHKYTLVNAFSIKLPNLTAVNAISKNPNVEYIEEVSIVYALGDVQPWGVIAVNAPQTWSSSTGSGVNVCVIDTGIDYNHPELIGVYKGGYDFVNSDSDPYDDAGHGTHCAGTIAAELNNSGIIGVAYNANIYSCKVLNAEGSGYTDDILAAVQWAVDNGMDIASMSLGGGRKSTTEDIAYQNAYNAGLLIICASGNDGTTRISYPAKYTSNVAVGAIDSNLLIADFSNTGREQEVVAPGVAVKSTVPIGSGFESSVQEGTTVYESLGMEFSAETGGLTKTAVYCGLGLVTDDFSGVSGNIALIQRGDISFADKATNAMNAGALGVIIYNNEPGIFSGTLGEAGDWVPVVSMSMEEGPLLTDKTVTIISGPGDYDTWDGTSMACPHVAAVAALILAENPALTNVEVRAILSNTATDLGASGFDTIFGNGLVNAEAGVIAAGGGGTTNNPPVADFTYAANLLEVSFTDQSSDSDGTVASYSWNFGDGASSTLQNPNHIYSASGTYTVTLTVYDDESASNSTDQSITVSDGSGGSSYMSVSDISFSIKSAGPNDTCTSSVIIVDENGSPVANAVVYVTMSGLDNSSYSGTTGVDGKVSFISPKTKSTGYWTCTVTNVTHAVNTYDVGSNTETSDTVTN